MRPSSARVPRRGLRCSSTSRSFTIGSACTRPWATEPRLRLAPTWRRSPCERQPNILIAPLHTKGGGPVNPKVDPEAARVALDAWLADARACGVRALETFAAGLERDGAAIRAALTAPWSSGQAEGQITRLKQIKRQMYGRASFDLLRRRVLLAA